MKHAGVLLILILLVVEIVSAQAIPPESVNYQGVLRNASDIPLEGPHNMIFRFYDADPGGNLLFTDSHTGGAAVQVTGGLFNVRIGEGTPGTGTYGSLAGMFAQEAQVYLEVQVGGDPPMVPRIRIASSAYALNSTYLGGRARNYFLDTSSNTQSKTGGLIIDNLEPASWGIMGYGSAGGAHFKDSGQSGYSHVGYGDTGIEGFGNARGGYFKDLNETGYASVGVGDRGIDAYGEEMGGKFRAWPGTQVFLAYEDLGLIAWGDHVGGLFYDNNASGHAYVGYGDTGIEGFGNARGGYFEDQGQTGQASLGIGDRGIEARGDEMGGRFDSWPGTVAYIAFEDVGLYATGNHAGGWFYDSDQSGQAFLATGHQGIDARGNVAGGYFKDSDGTGYAYAGYGSYGIYAEGSYDAGYFRADSPGGWGVEAHGQAMGGYFRDLDDGSVARVGYSTYKIQGTGTPSFVQNHPYDEDKVIVYSSVEGDEVATYTRGSARLEDGEARVQLGETFKWVTNPDVGLTAFVTPREEAIPLAVVSLTPEELVVHGPAEQSPDAAFDYIVYGLRIGFEEVSIVQEKQEQARIPSMAEHRRRYELRPELRSYNALERFKSMTSDTRGDGEIDLSRAAALLAAIEEYDPSVHGELHPDRSETQTRTRTPTSMDSPNRLLADPDRMVVQGEPHVAKSVTGENDAGDSACRHQVSELTRVVSVSGNVEAGDVLAFGMEGSGVMQLTTTPAAPTVFGIVAAGPGLVPDIPSIDEASEFGLDDELSRTTAAARVSVVISGVVDCKVDAGYGSILPGDLLTTSATPGHAMVAHDPLPGTILGKALETLEAGRDSIKVLVMLR